MKKSLKFNYKRNYRVCKTRRRQVIDHIHVFEREFLLRTYNARLLELFFGLAHARTIEENGFALFVLEILMSIVERVFGKPCAIAKAREREEIVVVYSYFNAFLRH